MICLFSEVLRSSADNPMFGSPAISMRPVGFADRPPGRIALVGWGLTSVLDHYRSKKSRYLLGKPFPLQREIDSGSMTCGDPVNSSGFVETHGFVASHKTR
jgi:hypothetical protein